MLVLSGKRRAAKFPQLLYVLAHYCHRVVPEICNTRSFFFEAGNLGKTGYDPLASGIHLSMVVWESQGIKRKLKGMQRSLGSLGLSLAKVILAILGDFRGETLVSLGDFR